MALENSALSRLTASRFTMLLLTMVLIIIIQNILEKMVLALFYLLVDIILKVAILLTTKNIQMTQPVLTRTGKLMMKVILNGLLMVLQLRQLQPHQ